MEKEEISLKGLDSFSKTFLVGTKDTPQKADVQVQKGQTLSNEGHAKYAEELQKDFIRRAGSFTEDLVAFIMEQRKKRDLTNIETIFAVALANINLREDYGGAPGNPTQEQQLAEFDAICFGAQEYYDANI